VAISLKDMNRSKLTTNWPAAVGFVSLVFTACQQIPPAPIDPAANGQRLGARSLRDPAVRAALARHNQPIVSEGDWSLDQLTLAAWTLRSDVARSRSELQAAWAVAGVASQRPNPTLSSTNERVVNHTRADPWVIGAALALTFETGGKRGIRRQRALAQQDAREWQLGETLWLARSEVRQALLERALAERVVALDDEELRLRRDYLDWVETRLARGAATGQERFLALESLSEVESRRELDRASLAADLATLSAAIGVSSREMASVHPHLPSLEELPALADSDLNAARDLALSNRLDIRRALAEYEVVEQDVQAAVALQYPDLTLAPGYLFDQNEHKITLGLGLPVPVFHNSGAAIQEAVMARKVAAAKFDEVQSRALGEIEISVAQYQATRVALETAQRAEREARSAFAAMERRFASGAASRGQLLAAQLALMTRRRNTLAARRATLEAMTALENSVERPLFPPSWIEVTAELEESDLAQSR